MVGYLVDFERDFGSGFRVIGSYGRVLSSMF